MTIWSVSFQLPDLMGHTLKILDALNEVGLHIVVMIVDRHKTNESEHCSTNTL